jgi:hypothetical protein
MFGQEAGDIEMTDPRTWIRRTIEIRSKCDSEFDWNVDSGMRMRITGIRWVDDDVAEISVDLSEWVEYNQRHMQSNFYDKDGIPCLNAYEAGMIKNHCDYLYAERGDWTQWFSVIKENEQ